MSVITIRNQPVSSSVKDTAEIPSGTVFVGRFRVGGELGLFVRNGSKIIPLKNPDRWYDSYGLGHREIFDYEEVDIEITILGSTRK